MVPRVETWAKPWAESSPVAPLGHALRAVGMTGALNTYQARAVFHDPLGRGHIPIPLGQQIRHFEQLMTGGPNFGVLVWCHEDNAISKLWLIRFLPENG